MKYLSRFIPFLRPYLMTMVGAGILVMGVAACNLLLIRLGGTLWDLITVQRDLAQLTSMVWVFSTEPVCPHEPSGQTKMPSP